MTTINEKGIVALIWPIMFQINVGTENGYVSARTVTMQLEFKVQFKEKVSKETGERVLLYKPVNINMPRMKVFSKNKEQPLEAMLLSSLLNV